MFGSRGVQSWIHLRGNCRAIRAWHRAAFQVTVAKLEAHERVPYGLGPRMVAEPTSKRLSNEWQSDVRSSRAAFSRCGGGELLYLKGFSDEQRFREEHRVAAEGGKEQNNHERADAREGYLGREVSNSRRVKRESA